MIHYRYDGTFSGFLSAVFEVWDRGVWPAKIDSPHAMPDLFDPSVQVETADNHYERVLKGIEKIGGRSLSRRFYHVFLSNQPGIEDLLLRLLVKMFNQKRNLTSDLSIEEVLEFNQLERKVLREVHRVQMFLRFEQAADNTWFAPVAPKYDILPLTIAHFKSRFADQCWLIYDTKRDYGFSYDTHTVEEVIISQPVFDKDSGNLPSELRSQSEEQWQKLWRSYFKDIAIKKELIRNFKDNLCPKGSGIT